MQLGADGGAELILRLPFQQQGDALSYGGQIHGGKAYGQSILFRTVFYIHGHIIHQPAPDKVCQPVRMGPVGIQLHGEAHGLDLLQQGPNVPQQGFPAGDSHAIQQTPALLQKAEQRFLFHFRGPGAVQQFSIMAVRAAEVAASQENRTGHPAGKVQQGHFLQPMNHHNGSSPCFTRCRECAADALRPPGYGR